MLPPDVLIFPPDDLMLLPHDLILLPHFLTFSPHDLKGQKLSNTGWRLKADTWCITHINLQPERLHNRQQLAPIHKDIAKSHDTAQQHIQSSETIPVKEKIIPMTFFSSCLIKFPGCLLL